MIPPPAAIERHRRNPRRLGLGRDRQPDLFRRRRCSRRFSVPNRARRCRCSPPPPAFGPHSRRSLARKCACRCGKRSAADAPACRTRSPAPIFFAAEAAPASFCSCQPCSGPYLAAAPAPANALPGLIFTTSPSYRTPLPLYGSGLRTRRTSLANCPTNCLSGPRHVNLRALPPSPSPPPEPSR